CESRQPCCSFRCLKQLLLEEPPSEPSSLVSFQGSFCTFGFHQQLLQQILLLHFHHSSPFASPRKGQGHCFLLYRALCPRKTLACVLPVQNLLHVVQHIGLARRTSGPMPYFLSLFLQHLDHLVERLHVVTSFRISPSNICSSYQKCCLSQRCRRFGNQPANGLVRVVAGLSQQRSQLYVPRRSDRCHTVLGRNSRRSLQEALPSLLCPGELEPLQLQSVIYRKRQGRNRIQRAVSECSPRLLWQPKDSRRPSSLEQDRCPCQGL